MKKIAFVFIAAMAVLSFGTGCKKKGGMAEAMGKMEGFKTEMCKCADKACAEKVSKAMDEWTKSMGDKGEKMAKEASDEDKKKMGAITDEMGKCMTKLMTPAMPDGSAAAPPAPPAGDEKKMDDKGAAPAGDEKKADDKAAPAGDEKKMDDKKDDKK